MESSEKDFTKSLTVDKDKIYLASYYTTADNDLEKPGNIDILVSVIDSEGDFKWDKTFGGGGDDDPFKILKTADGNLLIIGSTNSTDGMFSDSKGGTDGFVMKIDAEGKLLWVRQFGGAGEDFILSGTISENGDIYLAGVTESDDQGLISHGLLDGWLAKVSSVGELVWQHSYGGSNNDLLVDIEFVNDSQLVSCGRTRSADQGVEGYTGTPKGVVDNGWIVLLNIEGEILHQHCFGESDDIDISFSSLNVGDDGRILVGGEISEIIDSHFSGNYGLIVADYSTTLEINDTSLIGGTGNYTLNSMLKGESGNLYLVGSRSSQGANIFEPFGPTDQYVVKLNSDLELIWEYSSGIEGIDLALAAALDSEGNLILGGSRDNNSKLTKLSPQSLFSNEVFLCQGDSLWINGSNVSGEGVYYDTLASMSGSDSIVKYHLNMLPSYHFESRINSICNTDIILHDSSIAESGEYYFVFKSAAGCDSIYSYVVDFMHVDSRVEVEGSRLTAFQSGALYQWYDCSTNQPMEGSVGRSFMVSESGIYKVRIDVMGCLVESDCYHVASTVIREVEQESLKIYPNPVESFIVISLDAVEIRSVKVMDTMGSVKAAFNGSGNREELDVSGWPGGIYIVQVDTDLSVLIKRILIK